MMLLEYKLHYVPMVTIGHFSKYTKNVIINVINNVIIRKHGYTSMFSVFFTKGKQLK